MHLCKFCNNYQSVGQTQETETSPIANRVLRNQQYKYVGLSLGIGSIIIFISFAVTSMLLPSSSKQNAKSLMDKAFFAPIPTTLPLTNSPQAVMYSDAKSAQIYMRIPNLWLEAESSFVYAEQVTNGLGLRNLWYNIFPLI